MKLEGQNAKKPNFPYVKYESFQIFQTFNQLIQSLTAAIHSEN